MISKGNFDCTKGHRKKATGESRPLTNVAAKGRGHARTKFCFQTEQARSSGESAVGIFLRRYTLPWVYSRKIPKPCTQQQPTEYCRCRLLMYIQSNLRSRMFSISLLTVWMLLRVLDSPVNCVYRIVREDKRLTERLRNVRPVTEYSKHYSYLFSTTSKFLDCTKLRRRSPLHDLGRALDKL